MFFATLFGQVVVGDLQVRNIKRSRVQLNHLAVFFFVCVFFGALNLNVFFLGCEFRKPFGCFFDIITVDLLVRKTFPGSRMKFMMRK